MTTRLEDSNQIPPIGLGTWQNDDPKQCAETVENALEMGYRHIDTAQMYENEKHVGKGIRRSSVSEDEIFLATKVSFKNLRPQEVLETARASRERLGVEIIDLLYVHWPAGEYSANTTMPAFDQLVDEGVIRYIGVSNFPQELLEDARDVLNHPIYAHQFEMHPRFPQDELRSYGEKHGIHSVAYSPFEHGEIFDDPILQEIADRLNITVAQVCLAWICSKNAYPLPKATGKQHLRENLDAGDISLPQQAIDRIDEEMKNERYIDPPFAPW